MTCHGNSLKLPLKIPITTIEAVKVRIYVLLRYKNPYFWPFKTIFQPKPGNKSWSKSCFDNALTMARLSEGFGPTSGVIQWLKVPIT